MTPNDSATSDGGDQPTQRANDATAAQQAAQQETQQRTLGDADQRAVDLLVDHGFDLDAAVRANPGERARLEAGASSRQARDAGAGEGKRALEAREAGL